MGWCPILQKVSCLKRANAWSVVVQGTCVSLGTNSQ